MAEADVLQGVYQGAEAAGYRIAGISATESETVMAGSAAEGVEVGTRVIATVREAADGRLLPRAGDAAPSDPPAHWLLRIDVSPQIIFDGSQRATTVWVAYVRRIDVGTTRVVSVGKSGPTTAEEETLANGRDWVEVMNDATARDAIVEAHAPDPATAVAQALGRLGPRPAPRSPRRRAVLATVAAASLVIAAAALFLVNRGGGNDRAVGDEAAPTSPAEQVPTESDTTAPAAPTAPTAPAVTEAPTVPTTTTPPADPVEVAVGVVFVGFGTADEAVTWDVPQVRRIGAASVARSEFLLIAPPVFGDEFDYLAIFRDERCLQGACEAVGEAYVFVGRDQSSSAVRFGAGDPPLDRTFLRPGFGSATTVDTGCSAVAAAGSLPVHPDTADSFGMGLYYTNPVDPFHTDTIFSTLTGLGNQSFVMVRGEGEDHGAFVPSPLDAWLDGFEGCLSANSPTLAAVSHVVSSSPEFPGFTPASTSGVVLPDGTILDWSDIAAGLRQLEPTPERESLASALDGGAAPGPGQQATLAEGIAQALSVSSS